MRALRIAAASVQLALPDLDEVVPGERWWALPESSRTQVLALLSRLIARGVLIEAGPLTVAAGSETDDE